MRAMAPDAEALRAERAALREMLTRPLREVPPIYFYDDHGSALFERITALDAYYPTRTELAILEAHAADIARETAPRRVVELGSGAGRKIGMILDACPRDPGVDCTLLDVNETFLAASIAALRPRHPHVRFDGVVGDFTRDLHRLGPGGGRLIAFFAGTVGNLYPPARVAFFRDIAARMERSDALLLGVDLVKDHARLQAAYDDPEGVTAAFNRNTLRVLNQRFGGDFDPDAFAHRAFYDADNAWIEMRLRATRAQTVHLRDLDLRLDLAHGEEIRTEVSCKFTRASLDASAREGGLAVASFRTDPEGLFALAVLRSVA
jgi:L-histidine N-alpha-methyltransferase